jgi:hypothetical protein
MAGGKNLIGMARALGRESFADFVVVVQENVARAGTREKGEVRKDKLEGRHPGFSEEADKVFRGEQIVLIWDSC